jgi:3-oxoacyl-[acyl-carrier-protein] synthase II
MDPDGEQIVRAMRLAIERSGRALEEIGYVNHHGTSTMLNDAVESRCVRQLFGDRADRVPGSSTKSMIGHPQGASGAAGIVTAALALSRGFLPPTINHRDADPECDLDYIPNTGRAARPLAALCNCLGFGPESRLCWAPDGWRAVSTPNPQLQLLRPHLLSKPRVRSEAPSQ